MPIKFGDLLENQNTSYAVVDGTNNSVKGLIFATGLPSGADYPNLRADGCLLVDEDSGAMYIYTGADLSNGNWGNSANWASFATGDPETQQTTDLPVSIPAGTSFGRFQNGDTISVSGGKNAIEIIRDAVTSYIAPTAAFISTQQSAIQYSVNSQSITRTVSFTVTNQNQLVVDGTNFGIQSVKAYRRIGSGGWNLVASTVGADSAAFVTNGLAALNTVGSPSAESFVLSDTFTVGAGVNSQVRYKIEVTPLDGNGDAATVVEVEGAGANNGYINIQSYVAGSVTEYSVVRQDTGDFVGTAESNTIREKGNIASKISFKIKCNTPQVPLTIFTIQRSVNGESYENIHTVTNLNQTGTSTLYKFFDSIATTAGEVTGLSGTPSGFTDVTSALPDADRDADTIRYRIRLGDGEDGGYTATSGLSSTINLEFPSMIGYSTTDGSEFTSANDSAMTGILHGIRDTSANRAQYEIFSTTESGAANFGAAITLSTNGSQFVYIAFPDGYNDLTEVMSGAIDNLGSFNSSPKSSTVDFTTKFGITDSSYKVYCSNSPGAFNGSFTLT